MMMMFSAKLKKLSTREEPSRGLIINNPESSETGRSCTRLHMRFKGQAWKAPRTVAVMDKPTSVRVM